MIHKTVKIFFFVLITNLSFGQDSIWYLQSLKNPKKVHKITNKLDISISMLKLDSNRYYSGNFYRGFLQKVDSNKIIMKVTSESLWDTLPNGKEVITSKEYSPDNFKKNIDGEIRNIDINRINFISYYKGNDKIHMASEYYCYISLFAALVVSPLACINFKSGSFNLDRYYIALACSGAVFTVSLTFWLTSYKSYILNIKNNARNKSYIDYYKFSSEKKEYRK